MTAGRPLAGRRVVVTRSEEQADSLAQKLRDLGAEPLLVPSIYTRPSPDAAALADAARGLDGAAWVGVTSPNGVRHGWPAVAGAWPDGLPETLRVAAVGPATAEALRAVGVEADFIPASHTGDDFAADLPLAPGDRVVLLRSDIARQAIADRLRQRGADVLDVPAYETVTSADPEAVRAALAERPDAVTFTSPSTVRGFLTGLGDPRRLDGVHLFPIGPVTARELAPYGLRPTALPDDYTIDGLLRALVHLFRDADPPAP